MIDRLTLNLVGAFADLVRTLIREWQREGIRLAQAAYEHKGRAQRHTTEQLMNVRRAMEPGVPNAKVGLGLDDRPDDPLSVSCSECCGCSGGGVGRPSRF